MAFVSNICLAAIAAALYKMLVPENKFAKQISLLLVSVFLITGVTAVTGVDFSSLGGEISLSENAEFISFSNEINDDLKQKVCSDMEEKIRALLAESGIFPDEVHIIVNISGLYSINITEVKVVFASGEKEEAEIARKILENALSDIKVTVLLK